MTAKFRLTRVDATPNSKVEGWAVECTDDSGKTWIVLTSILPTETGARLAMDRLQKIDDETVTWAKAQASNDGNSTN
jgi:hypothetical protein